MTGRRRLGSALTSLVLLGIPFAAREARAVVRAQLLVIGNNHAFSGEADPTEDLRLSPLRYADDDAAAFYEFMAQTADTAHLLTVMDSETQGRFPKLASLARPPTLAEVREAIEHLRRRIEDNRRRGDQNVLYVFFSGHGVVRPGTGPALALLDGYVSHDLLYEEILSKIPADFVHVFIDACHAEGVVRPRDADARSVPVSAAEAEAFLLHSTLARFPHVGAIVAASSDSRSHEWDQLSHGVFTSELLSALRGAADVNRDQRIEYSEVYAFLSAANRGVRDPRARLTVVARPPELDRHAAIVDLSVFPMAGATLLTGIATGGRLMEVEDGMGQRLATVRGEPDFVVDLMVPAGPTYLRVDQGEARFEGHSGDRIRFDGLKFIPPRARTRGALEDAIRQGLFVGEFGRRYYDGFIDQAADFSPVTFSLPTEVGVSAGPGTTETSEQRRRVFPEIVVGLGVLRTVADGFTMGQELRVGLRPAVGSGLTVSLDIARAAQGQIEERQAIASAGWLWWRKLGPTQGWIGGSLGGGFVEQLAAGESTRRSPVLALGPELGASIDIVNGVALWAGGQLAALVYRGESGGAVGFRPALLAGASFAP